jgi:hypothetical protein
MNKPNKKSILPEAGNTQELERLKEELRISEEIRARILNEKAEVQEELSTSKRECCQLKEALDVATNKIRMLEAVNDKDQSETARPGYVEIVAIPPKKGIRPIQKVIDGIPAQRKIDEDGYCYDTLPIKNAIPLLTEKAGMKHVLVGPVDEIQAEEMHGMYSRKVTIKRHVKRKDITGATYWVPVEIEESKDKSE